MGLRARKISGLSRNGPLISCQRMIYPVRFLDWIHLEPVPSGHSFICGPQTNDLYCLSHQRRRKTSCRCFHIIQNSQHWKQYLHWWTFQRNSFPGSNHGETLYHYLATRLQYNASSSVLSLLCSRSFCRHRGHQRSINWPERNCLWRNRDNRTRPWDNCKLLASGSTPPSALPSFPTKAGKLAIGLLAFNGASLDNGTLIKVAEHSFWYLCFIHLFSKTLDLSVTKNGSKQVNNTNFGFLMVKLTYVPLPWQHE